MRVALAGADHDPTLGRHQRAKSSGFTPRTAVMRGHCGRRSFTSFELLTSWQSRVFSRSTRQEHTPPAISDQQHGRCWRCRPPAIACAGGCRTRIGDSVPPPKYMAGRHRHDGDFLLVQETAAVRGARNRGPANISGPTKDSCDRESFCQAGQTRCNGSRIGVREDHEVQMAYSLIPEKAGNCFGRESRITKGPLRPYRPTCPVRQLQGPRMSRVPRPESCTAELGGGLSEAPTQMGPQCWSRTLGA